MLALTGERDKRACESRSRADDLQPPVWIEINLAAIQHNLQQIRRFLSPRTKILAVVKANAYGHGEGPVAQALVEAGADLLGVASIVEGIALRERGIQAKILILGQILPEEAHLVVRHGLIQSVGDITIAESLSQQARCQEKLVSVHFKIDTGMGRYGVWHEEAVSLMRRIVQLPGLSVDGTFTHLAMAGQNGQATEEQINRFKELLHRMKKAKLSAGLKHIANSVGVIKFPASHEDLVRTGLLVYGASPVKNEGLPFSLKQTLSLKSRIRFLKTIGVGQTVSYGGTYRATRPTKVATIPVGYAHGYARALSNKAQLLVRGVRAPVIGKITMEDLMADMTDVPAVQVGDEAVLLGRQGNEVITAEELARHARTIPYEILAGLSVGIPRFYRTLK